MRARRLHLDSAYETYDLDKDGTVSIAEMKKVQDVIDSDNRDQKEDQQRKMAWMAVYSMVILTILLLLPFIAVERVEALSDLLGMFYISMAGVIAAFFGSAAYMSVNK